VWRAVNYNKEEHFLPGPGKVTGLRGAKLVSEDLIWMRI
jgi:hypothetical protein